MNGTATVDCKRSGKTHTFKEFLASKGLRITPQRLAIFEAATRKREQFTAEELLKEAVMIDDSVSRATLYRTLPLLLEYGVLRELDVGKDYKFYLPNQDSDIFQTQVICSDCEKIFEVEAPFLEWYGKTVSEKLGMEVETQRLQITSSCLKRGNEKVCERRCS